MDLFWFIKKKSKPVLHYYEFEPLVLEPNNNITDPVAKAKELKTRKKEVKLCIEQNICYLCGGPILKECKYDNCENDPQDIMLYSCTACKMGLLSEIC